MAERGIPATAYSPVEQGRIPKGGALQAVADRHGVTPHQVALAWAVRSGNVFAIPKAAEAAHVRQNRAGADLVLSSEDVAQSTRSFRRPVAHLLSRCCERPSRTSAAKTVDDLGVAHEAIFPCPAGPLIIVEACWGLSFPRADRREVRRAIGTSGVRKKADGRY